MITAIPAIDPTLVNIILIGLIEREKTLDALAADVGLDLDDLLELLENPEMQARIHRLQRLLDQRAALLASASECDALGALTGFMEQVRASQGRREKVLAERDHARNAPPGPERTRAIAACDAEIEEIERQFKELVEASRSARALLAFVKARKARPPRADMPAETSDSPSERTSAPTLVRT